MRDEERERQCGCREGAYRADARGRIRSGSGGSAGVAAGGGGDGGPGPAVLSGWRHPGEDED